MSSLNFAGFEEYKPKKIFNNMMMRIDVKQNTWLNEEALEEAWN